MPTKESYFLKTLANGISVLEAIADAHDPLTLSEIANGLGTTKTSATRICYTLSELKLIERNKLNRYKLTPNVLKFGYAAICALGWRGVAKFYLEDLFQEVRETTNLSILDGTEVLYLLRIRKGDFFPFDIRTGSKVPINCTAMGKVLMAFGQSERTREILQNMNFRQLTIHSIATRDEFVEELRKVKSAGFAINNEELSIGICGIAAPIVNEREEAIAAIGVAVSTSRYSKEDIEKTLAPPVMRVGRQISEALIQMELPKIQVTL
jgi:IclR family pca regulon transcriptional regulator